MTRRLVLLLLLLMTPSANAAGVKWSIMPENSFVRFSGVQAGDLPFAGEFTDYSADLCFDERAIDEAWARFEFDVASANTGVDERDEILRSEEWMNAAAYPTTTFETDHITRTGPNSYQADGTLTLKGTPRPLTVAFTLTLVEEIAAGSFTIDRRDFNIGDGAWGETEKWVAYPINVSFQLAAATKGEACDDR